MFLGGESDVRVVLQYVLQWCFVVSWVSAFYC
jgi:hypothetical protein